MRLHYRESLIECVRAQGLPASPLKGFSAKKPPKCKALFSLKSAIQKWPFVWLLSICTAIHRYKSISWLLERVHKRVWPSRSRRRARSAHHEVWLGSPDASGHGDPRTNADGEIVIGYSQDRSQGMAQSPP
jgi:hypothetical protein